MNVGKVPSVSLQLGSTVVFTTASWRR